MSQGYEDLRLVKLLLESSQGKSSNDRTHEMILFGASLEALRDVKEKVERMNERLMMMEQPRQAKQEKTLIEQIQELSQAEKDALLQFLQPRREEEPRAVLEDENSRFDAVEVPIIESVADRKKTLIRETIQKYGRINSSQLARIIGLSRTRCNEYLKDLEISGELTAMTEDKKRYYQLK